MSCSSPPPPSATPTAVEKDYPAVILNGDFPDPTIVRDGEDFYLTHSSFHAVPGLPIWHSRNLREWKMITRALRTYVGNVWAPELIKHDDQFFLYFPANGTNWVMTAKSPAGPWSDPVNLKVGGIDPGHVVAPDGKRYLHLSAGKAVELAPDGLSVKGEPQTVYAGWPYPDDWVAECFCLESPKLFFHKGFYHLVSAQGGTAGPATSHMAVSARSASPLGPWENSPHNPFIRTYSAEEFWWSKGHATVFDAGDDKWFAVYHAFQKNLRQHGRQVLLEPVAWTADGWFKLVEPDKDQFRARTIRNHVLSSDDFSSSELNLQWQFDGSQFTPEFVLNDGTLTLPAQQGKPTVLYAQNSDPDFEISVRLSPGGNVETGLVLYFRPDAFVGIGRTGSKGTLFTGGIADERRAFDCARCEYWKLRLIDNALSMYWSEDGKSWTKHQRSLDISALHGNAHGGFASLKPAVFVRVLDRGKGNVAVDDFAYEPLR
ncbi:MAG: family 43 glycosylhydrolase [Bryobacterales bacterium]|nr:family 43 glycosylhydrolase [Bryobacterales bacterium]